MADEIDPYAELAAQVKWLRRHARGLWTALVATVVWCSKYL